MKKTKLITVITLAALIPFAATAKPIAAPAKPAAAAVVKSSTPAGWTDDFNAAKKQAAAEGKDLLVAFSGSDWCGWCIRLEHEVFSKDGFAEKVSELFVPVYIDNPNDTNRLSEVAKKQNGALTQHYRIRGFPTVLLMDSDGDVFAETGYAEGGPEKYLEHLKKISDEGKDSAQYKTQKAIARVPTGPDRAKQLDELLATMPLSVQIFNLKYIQEILAADPDGKLGLRAKYPYFTTVMPIEEEFRLTMHKLSKLADEAIKAAGSPNAKNERMSIMNNVLKENLQIFDGIRVRAESAKKLFPKNAPAVRPLQEILIQLHYMTQTAKGLPMTPPPNID
ncbi:MAG: thioredoxin family protein [Opitutales bacterium]|nr:thioredoxin family protein [Opitutales bacterium]